MTWTKELIFVYQWLRILKSDILNNVSVSLPVSLADIIVLD